MPTGDDDTASLLLPLYVVIAAGCAAHLWRALRGRAEVAEAPREDPRTRRLAQALAVVVVLYALQALYSSDVEHAVKTVGFFYVPFAVSFRLLVEVRWSRRLLLQAFGLTVGLALLFAAVGFVEWATGRLLISNEKVLAANDLKPYFRVNSLFFDPNVYGRFLALVMVVLAGVLLWAPARRDVTRVAVALALLWAALVLTLSESSFAALLVGLAVLAALRWRPWPVVAVCGGLVAAAVALVVLAPGALGLKTDSFSALNESSSGRAKLIRGGAQMVGDRPLTGFGSGSFADQYRERERVVSSRLSAESHTIPVTIAAEQGAIGLAAYGFLLLDRVRGRLRRAAAHAAAPRRGRRAGRALRRRGGVLRAAAAHVRLRGVPGGPADLDAAGDGRRAAARGARGRRGGRAARAARRAAPSRFRPEPLLPLTGAPPHRRDRRGRCDGPRGGGGRGGRLSRLPRARGRPADPARDARGA